MIDGVIVTCPSCGLDVEAVKGMQRVARSGAQTVVLYKCDECGYVGQLSYGRDWFKRHIAPALRWWVRRQGPRPRTPNEIAVKTMEIDMEAVETVADLQLYWHDQERHRPETVPRGFV